MNMVIKESLPSGNNPNYSLLKAQEHFDELFS